MELPIFVHVLLSAAFLVSAAPVEKADKPVLLHDEVKNHYTSFRGETQFAEMTTLLDQIQRVAKRIFYGNVTIGLKDDGNRQKSVSISIAQPGLEMPIMKYLFEGDILLTPKQAHEILSSLLRFFRRKKRAVKSGLARFRHRVKRKLYKRENARWRKLPIKYTFHHSLSSEKQGEIRRAVNFWQDSTCLTFQRYASGGVNGDHIEFFRGSGCYSMIGRVGGKQGISIGDGCERIGIIEHEIGHAIGLWHEQSRPDADCCISIVSENIIPETISNFLQRTSDDVITHSVPYDLGSVMHYGPTAFTNDWTKKTILTNDHAYQRTIGQREKLSFYDIQIINKEYCADKCSGTNLGCLYGGYPHPAHCRSCICPDGLGGNRCEENEQAKNAKCGGVLSATNEYKSISSPGYPSPGYGLDQKCSWLLRAPKGKRILLQFIEQWQFFCTTTCLDFVEVKNTHDLALTGKRYCCFDKPEFPIYSDGNEMLLIFRSTISRDVGFKARFRYYPEGPSATTPKATPPTTRRRTRPPTTTQPTTTTTERPTNEWSVWGAWSSCSKSCGGCGVKSRVRVCNSSPCTGDRQQFRKCGFGLCPGSATCTRLNFFDEPCKENHLGVCSRVSEVSFECNLPNCCPPFKPLRTRCALSYGNTGSWDEWSDWGACIGPKCGGCALQARHRVCNDWSCRGDSSEYRRCRTNACTECVRDDAAATLSDAPASANETAIASSVQCADDDDPDLCVDSQHRLSQTHFVCPCCQPLVERSGQCVSRR